MDSDPTPGDPEEVRELADELQTFSDDVAEALGKIRGLASDRAVQDWAGLSAEAFRNEFDGVPGNLEKLRDSYDLCAQALQTYWPKLQTAQGQADRALDRAIAAQADLTAAQGSLGSAQDWVGRAGDEAERLQREGERADAPAPDEAEVRAATRDRQAADEAQEAAQARVDTAQDSLDAARELARQAKEMREEAARQAARDIDDASDAGIHNRKWWQKAVHWVTENWDTIVDICKIVVAVLGVVVMIIGGPLAWVVLAAALVVLADTLVKYANGQASLWDVAFAALDCIPGMKGLTTLGGLARGLRGGLTAARTGLRGLAQGARGLGQNIRRMGRDIRSLFTCGDPIDMATGEMVLSATDIALAGVLPLVLERHHRSSLRTGRWFGVSWASTLDQRLVLGEHGLRFCTADGMLLEYAKPSPGTPMLPVEGPRWELRWDGTPGAAITVDQPENGRTLHFAPVPGCLGGELPLVAVTDRNGNRITLAYDTHGRPESIEHSGGIRIEVTTEDNRVTALRLASAPDRPVLMRYRYDAQGDLSGVVNSTGKALRFTYDSHHRLVRWEDRNGFFYAYTYDAAGRCVFTTGSDRALEYRYVYEPEEYRTTAQSAQGAVTVYRFDDAYRLVSETDPLGHTVRREYDRFDRALSVTDALGRTTRYAYDDAGHVTAVHRPDGSRISAEYNEAGLPSETVDADGSVVRRAYDSAGNLVAEVDATGSRTRYTYDARGGLASVTDALGRTTHVRCDESGLPVVVADPSGRITTYHRDAFGRPVEVVDALGGVSRVEWTVEGLPLRHVDPGGAQQSWRWDAEGNLLSHTDAAGGVRSFEYGPFDLPTAQTGPDGTRYAFRRDTELRLTEVEGPGGAVWRYAYDAAGHLTGESDFDGRGIGYSFDAAGRLVARTNAAGQTVRYERDDLGRITRKLVDGRETALSYDPLGRLLRATSPDTDLVIERDGAGRITAEHCDGRAVRHTYDAVGRPVDRVTPSGHVSTREYDAAGRLARIVTAGRTVEFTHDLLGRETRRRLGDGLELTRSWNATGGLAAQALVRGPDTVLSRTFAYRPDRHLTAIEDGDGGRTEFGLDALGRVTGVTRAGWSESYAYNGDGEQTDARWTGDGDHDAVGGRDHSGTRPTRAGRTHYVYDRAGRVVRRTRKRLSRRSDVWHYTWDAEDRLTAVTTPDGTRWRYRYDAFGRRVAKTRLGPDGAAVAEEVFAWSGTALVERAGSGPHARPTVLTWDYNGIEPIVQTHRDAEGGPGRFQAIVTGTACQATELVDEDGTTAWRDTSSVWGAPRSADPGSPAALPLRFAGQYADEETGWHYNYQRHYDPETARYVTPDPLGLAPAPNPYGYVPHPLTWVDPLGLAAHLFTNRMPGDLGGELRLAEDLGVTPLRPGGAAFDEAINSDAVKWAVLENGDLVVIPKFVQGQELAHSVLSRGNPVRAAGEANIAGGSDIGYWGAEISNHSGHFMPDNDSLQVGLDAFGAAGISFPASGISYAT
ncbi:DUF6531 domain-containing protein [Streptomyces sp. NPDC049879]|uniref:DUF6531 domain-containing protein n=1 Tax=Streptomyces sp. NPDC049879 TaxID=3365598 RepID=UPI00378E8A2D